LDVRIIYFGANVPVPHKDQGVTWDVISPDLTAMNRTSTAAAAFGGTTVQGGEIYNTIYAIAESRSNEGTSGWAPTDGLVQMTRGRTARPGPT